MDQKEFELFKKLTGEIELPPKGSQPRKLLDNYGLLAYVQSVQEEKKNPGDYNGDEDPWGSRD